MLGTEIASHVPPSLWGEALGGSCCLAPSLVFSTKPFERIPRLRSVSVRQIELEPFEVLAWCAEVAIAITGFSGVVLALSQRTGAGAPATAGLLFRMLFTGTLVPLGIIALASIFEAAALEHSLIWSICSFVHASAVLAIMGLSSSLRDGSALGRGQPLVLLGGFGVMALQFTNVVSLHSFWPVLVAVWWGISLSLLAFMRLLFASRTA